MLLLKNVEIKLVDEDKVILSNINLEIGVGSVHYITGRNGSGKSSLVNAIMGHPNYNITKGEVLIKGEVFDKFLLSSCKIENSSTIRVNDLTPDKRSLLGIFLANQTPIEIPGVSLRQYLRLIYNSRLPESKKLPVFRFRKILEKSAEMINYPSKLLDRNLNEGFSGGEKKKTEILQMLILKPRYILMDEIDSGLDLESIGEVFNGINKFREENPNSSFLIISHYKNIQELIKPDYVHRVVGGKLEED